MTMMGLVVVALSVATAYGETLSIAHVSVLGMETSPYVRRPD